MPVKSKAQAGLMGAVCGGKAKNKPKGLSKEKACEYIRGQKIKSLPKRVAKKKSVKRKKK